MRYQPEPKFKHAHPHRTGILLINLGTPDAPTPSAVRRYLAEFLSDPRVVEIPQAIWWLILHGIILRTRPAKSAAKYASIWLKEGSPLRVWTEKQAKLLKGWLGEHQDKAIHVEMAMRYGNPSIESALKKIKSAGCDKLLIVPLYPQYAASTTASAFDEVTRVLQKTRNLPALRTVRSFYDDAGYIAALAASVRDHWQQNGRGDHLLMSFHGAPRYTLDKGDPYFCQCHATARMLADALGLQKEHYTVSFQSRFGRAKWFDPATDQTLHALGQKIGKLDVICPGFVADCLETLEEIAMEGKQVFLTAGGSEYRYIGCLNDRDDWIKALGMLVSKETQGWLTGQKVPDTNDLLTKQTSDA